MLNVENLNTLLSNKSDNLYVLCSIKVNNCKGTLSVNAPIPADITSKLCNELNNFDVDRLILVCRSSKEQYTKPFPYPETLNKIKEETNKNLHIFYQNPYPYTVPNFNNNLTVIRFGYDNGCLLDRMCVSQPEVDATNLEEGSHYYLISKNKTIYIK